MVGARRRAGRAAAGAIAHRRHPATSTVEPLPIKATQLQTFKAQFFRALAHPVRIKILELLIRGDHSVQELQGALELDQPVVSQQLAVLRNQGIVTSLKRGVSVRYSLRDPAIGELLDVARRIFNNHLVDSQGMLRELQREARRG